jgi:hypothetical protein
MVETVRAAECTESSERQSLDAPGTIGFDLYIAAIKPSEDARAALRAPKLPTLKGSKNV